jgi:hypothetical protein
MRPWILASLLLTACTSRSVPVSHADADVEVRTSGGERSLENDFVRTELRELHGVCEARIAALEENVDEAADREDVARVVAAAVYVVGEIADGGGDGEVMGRVGASDRGCAESPGDSGCGLTPVPSARAGQESPIHRDTVETQLSASDQIREINRTLDALDDFVFATPDPDAWTRDDRETWRSLGDSARELCGGRSGRASDDP